MLRKNVKSLLKQFQVCIFAEMIFGVRCTLTVEVNCLELKQNIDYLDLLVVLQQKPFICNNRSHGTNLSTL